MYIDEDAARMVLYGDITNLPVLALVTRMFYRVSVAAYAIIKERIKKNGYDSNLLCSLMWRTQDKIYRNVSCAINRYDTKTGRSMFAKIHTVDSCIMIRTKVTRDKKVMCCATYHGKLPPTRAQIWHCLQWARIVHPRSEFLNKALYSLLPRDGFSVRFNTYDTKTINTMALMEGNYVKDDCDSCMVLRQMDSINRTNAIRYSKTSRYGSQYNNHTTTAYEYIFRLS